MNTPIETFFKPWESIPHTFLRYIWGISVCCTQTPLLPPICPSSPNGHLYSLMVMTIFRVGIRMSDWLPRMSLHFNDIIPLIFTYVYVLGSARGSILKSLLSQILWNSSNVTKNNLLLLKIISVMSKKTNYFMIYIILIFSKSFLCIAHFTELDSIHKPQRSETFHSKTIYYRVFQGKVSHFIPSFR